MYILIAIVFIAEIIIVANILFLIINADKKIQQLNLCVSAFNPLCKTCLQYARCLVANFNISSKKVIHFIKTKQQQIAYKILIMICIYVLLFLFKFKMKKASKIYKLICTIRDTAVELLV